MTRNNQPAVPRPEQQIALPVGGQVQQAAAAPDPGAAGENVGLGAGQQATKDTLEFAWKVHGYTNEYIRFADAKAGVVMAWCAAMIGAMFSAKVHFYFLVKPSWGWEWKPTLLGAGGVLAYMVLVGSILFGVGAISPRLRPEPSKRKSWGEWFKELISVDAWKKWWSPARVKGMIFWDQVIAHENQNAYWQSLSAQQMTEMAHAVSGHDFTLAQITSEKYRCVKKSIQFAVLGSAAAVVMLLLAACWPPV